MMDYTKDLNRRSDNKTQADGSVIVKPSYEELEAAIKRVRGLLGDTNHDGSFIEIGKVRQAIIGEQNERQTDVKT